MAGGIFVRRKKICADVVGTRTDWVLKGKAGGMTTTAGSTLCELVSLLVESSRLRIDSEAVHRSTVQE